MSNQKPLEAGVLPGLKRTLSTDFTKDHKARSQQGESKSTPCTRVLKTDRQIDHSNTQKQTVFDEENNFVKPIYLLRTGEVRNNSGTI